MPLSINTSQSTQESQEADKRDFQIRVNKVLLTFLQLIDAMEFTSKLLSMGSIANDPPYIPRCHGGIGSGAEVSDQHHDDLPRWLLQEP